MVNSVIHTFFISSTFSLLFPRQNVCTLRSYSKQFFLLKNIVLKFYTSKSNATIFQTVDNEVNSLQSIKISKQLPHIPTLNEIIKKSNEKICHINPNPRIKNIRNRLRKHGALTCSEFTNTLLKPITDWTQFYKKVSQERNKYLHPLETILIHLTFESIDKSDEPINLKESFLKIQRERKFFVSLGKSYASSMKYIKSSKEISNHRIKAINSLLSEFHRRIPNYIESLRYVAQKLKQIPNLTINIPTIVLVGSPNVGKSSLVNSLSSLKTEINNYPFTTRGLSIGHISIDTHSSKVSCQIMDTPGLLFRDTRNKMELLTLGTMQHLPVCVMYIIDLSGNAGAECSSIKNQLQLRKEIKKKFPKRPWIDVVSKIDLGTTFLQEYEYVIKQDLHPQNNGKYFKISAEKNVGIKILREKVDTLLHDMSYILDSMQYFKQIN